MGVKRTDMTKVDLGSIGLTLFHPIVAGKGQLADREHRDWLEFLIGPGPGLRFEKEVGRLLNDIGHGHVGIRIIKGFTQRPDFLLDQSIVFVGLPLPLGRLNQLIRE